MKKDNAGRWPWHVVSPSLSVPKILGEGFRKGASFVPEMTLAS